jgi:decaprenylphospho-beta-D-erythro-pentofuranosid-2-ulose 2-reductase
MNKILIIGAASAIAQETAKCFAKENAKLFLTDINIGRLEAVRADLLARNTTRIFIEVMDVNDFEGHQEIINKAVEALGGLDAVLIAHGILGDQIKSQENPKLIVKEFNTNALSVILLASHAANYFEKQKSGCIAVISSVAGDRGRQSNYIYGSAKGAVTTFLQGLRNRMSQHNVNVLTIKPGQVDTPMTADMPKSPLFAKASVVGKGIFDAMKNGKDVAYLPGFWRLIMCAVKAIPEGIFKKMKM